MAFLQHMGALLRQSAARSVLRTAPTQIVPALYMGTRGMAGTKLFIGGLPWDTSEDTLKEAFSSFGDVEEAKIVTDRTTGNSRGFGFIHFTDEESAKAAIQEMDGRDFSGRTIRVDYATERTPEERAERRQRRGGYGGGGGGYGGGGGGGYGGGRGGGGRGGYGGGRGGYGDSGGYDGGYGQ
eukprot:jgi/Mesen1/2782/ME000170S01899